MNSIIISAITFGFFTGFHCLGMCGPIALALPLPKSGSFIDLLSGRLFYNFGRVVTYTILGIILGSLGLVFSLGGFQQQISIVSGIIIILLAVVPASLHKLNFFAPLSARLTKLFGGLFGKSGVGAQFVIGLLNGLLPCGPVYLALVGAIGTGSVVMGGAFMAFFGLGTVPLMLTFSLATGFISGKLRNRFAKVLPYLSVLLGILFILRGLDLGIPFLSPNMEMIKQKVEKVSPKSDLTDEEAPCCH